ncbi:MAG TPA: nucleic acid-binding protein [Chloroflexota bacterium]|jgi:predicted nucleic acid-binding protein
MLCNPTAASPETITCKLWFEDRLSHGADFAIPEIADYEIRRELLLGGRTESLRRLDLFKSSLIYVPITTPMMLRAAELWALARQRGRPTAGGEALDGDMILCAQWDWARARSDDVVIATTNVRHLSEFSDARVWREL